MNLSVSRRNAVLAAAVAGSALSSTALADEGVQAPVDVASLSEATALALPPDLAGLPVIVAQPFAEIAPGSPTDALEGIVFDKDETMYVCHRFREMVDGAEVTSSEICRVDGEGAVERFVYKPAASFNGIAIHRDGRFFVADMSGHVWVYGPEGGEPHGELPLEYGEVKILPNDLVFDANTGDLYLVNFNGGMLNLAGGIFRLSAESDYTQINEVLGGMATPNGISFDLNCANLYVAETALNRIVKVGIAEGAVSTGFLGCSVVYQGQGANGPDSNRLDANGNLYQAFYPDGRAVIFNRSMIAVANVVPFDRKNMQGWKTSSLALHPTRPEGYLISGGTRGMWVLKFDALAPGAPLWHLAG